MQRIGVPKGQFNDHFLIIEQHDFPLHAIDVHAIITSKLIGKRRQVFTQQDFD